MPMPPISCDIRSLLVSRTLVAARLIAATTRSWSMGMSLGSTTAGSILIETTSNWPLTTAVTMPPPAEASQVMRASSSCILVTSPCRRWAVFISCDRSGILGSDIGLDLLDRGPEGLEDELGGGVLARLGFALAALLGGALAGGLEHRARARGRARLLRREEPDREGDRATEVFAKEGA